MKSFRTTLAVQYIIINEHASALFLSLFKVQLTFYCDLI